jgi:signal transduction histidine kinase/DNA-binding response OmpR family regulator
MDLQKDFKILVVDDTPDLLDITVRAIKKVYQNVLAAPDGFGCMEALRNEKPDIILLDVMLPDVNGKDLAKKIKNSPEFSSVFIFLLSSLKTSSEDVSEGLEDGADGYIIRPVNNRELLAKVASACRIISAERESRLALLKYQSLFSAMQEGLYLHEMVYDQQGKAIDYRISEANPASEKHLNIKPEDAIGKLATELYKTPEAPFLEIYADVVETGNPVSFDQYLPLLKKHFQISAFSPVKGKFATAFSDITERKLAEEKIEFKNKQLQKIIAEKDKFFTIIAHDLKSPFNSILGFSELLVENAREKNFGSIEGYATTIHQSSKRAMDLLLNLMEWAQSQTGRMIFVPEVFNLVELIDEIVLMLESSAVQKKIQIKKVVPAETKVYADKAMVSTIFRNLISNAIKFSYPGGEISVSVTKNNNELVVAVGDTGIGIPKEIIGKLFQVDQNITTPGTQNEKGTGLGLILCKEFIEKHGGKIGVESEPGKGSKFYFNIPNTAVQPEKAAKNPTVISEGNQIKNLKIIIAEDDETSGQLISFHVRKFGNEIINVKTGREAVEACRKNPEIDLILMDIQMPDMNGYEATRRIREFNRDVVIIAQTAYALAGDRKKSMDAGCNDYISKPIKKDELQELIQKHFKTLE